MNRHAKKIIGVLAVAILLIAAVNALAAPNIKEKGVLEAVGEGSRSVTITTKGPSVDKVEREHRAVYQLSSPVIVLDGFGRRAKLDTLPLPVKVEFDVEYTPTGALIKKITVLPQ